MFSWSLFHKVMAEMAIWPAYVKHISAWEAGLGSGAFPLRECEAEVSSLACLAPGWWLQMGHLGNVLPPARWLRRAATAEANQYTCVTIAERALVLFWDQDRLFRPLQLCFSWTGSNWSRANGRLVEVSSAVGAEPASDRECGVSLSLVGFVFSYSPPPPLQHRLGCFPFCSERPVWPSAPCGRCWSRIVPVIAPVPQSPMSHHAALVLAHA